MPFEITTLEDQHQMAKYTVKERLYLTEDDRLVPEGDPEARFLFAPAGREISEDEARKYGLLEPAETDDSQPSSSDETEPVEPSEPREPAAPSSGEPEPKKDSPVVPDTGHVCPDCGKVTKTAFGLNSHRAAKHPA